MDSRRWQKKTWKTKEDIARYTERRFGRDGRGLSDARETVSDRAR